MSDIPERPTIARDGVVVDLNDRPDDGPVGAGAHEATEWVDTIMMFIPFMSTKCDRAKIIAALI